MNRVTSIIGSFNPATDFMNDQSALDFGTAVHEMCRLYDLKNLDESKLDENLKPYLVGYKKFLNDFEPEWELIEKRFENRLYTGRLDRKGIITAKKAIVDYKTGGIQTGACGLQLAAYSNLIDWNIDIGYVIQLKENTYSLAWYSKKELKRYYSIFQSMLNTYNFINNGFKL